MNIYLDPSHSSSSAAAVDTSSAHDEIASIYQTAKLSLLSGDEEAFKATLAKIGVDSVCSELHDVIRTIFTKTITITPSETISGILYLKEEAASDPFGVFKIGRKRANHEIFVHEISKLLGLSPHTLPGAFCTIENPVIPPVETLDGIEVVEELFNLGSKELLLSTQKDNTFLVGILEPFIPSSAGASSEDLKNFAKMVLLCTCLGIRDVKEDGHLGFRLIDVEDCMPTILDPLDKENPFAIPATDLSILTSPYASEVLPRPVEEELKALVSSWNPEELGGFLAGIPIRFADHKAERLADEHDGKKKHDAGNNKFIFHKFENRSHTGRPLFCGFSQKPYGETRLFDADQITTFIERVKRAQGFILSNSDFTVRDLVYAVDPFFKESVETLLACCEESTDDLLKQLKRFPVHQIAGHFNPSFIQAKAAASKKKK